MAWLYYDDVNPDPADMAGIMVCWYQGMDWSETVAGWLIAGNADVDLADGSLAEHEWRRVTDWHPVQLGHAAIVEWVGDDERRTARSRRAWTDRQLSRLPQSAALVTCGLVDRL